MMVEVNRDIEDYSFSADLDHYFRTRIVPDRKINRNEFMEILKDAIADGGVKPRELK